MAETLFFLSTAVLISFTGAFTSPPNAIPSSPPTFSLILTSQITSVFTTIFILLFLTWTAFPIPVGEQRFRVVFVVLTFVGVGAQVVWRACYVLGMGTGLMTPDMSRAAIGIGSIIDAVFQLMVLLGSSAVSAVWLRRVRRVLEGGILIGNAIGMGVLITAIPEPLFSESALGIIFLFLQLTSYSIALFYTIFTTPTITLSDIEKSSPKDDAYTNLSPLRRGHRKNISTMSISLPSPVAPSPEFRISRLQARYSVRTRSSALLAAAGLADSPRASVKKNEGPVTLLPAAFDPYSPTPIDAAPSYLQNEKTGSRMLAVLPLLQPDEQSVEGLSPPALTFPKKQPQQLFNAAPAGSAMLQLMREMDSYMVQTKDGINIALSPHKEAFAAIEGDQASQMVIRERSTATEKNYTIPLSTLFTSDPPVASLQPPAALPARISSLIRTRARLAPSLSSTMSTSPTTHLQSKSSVESSRTYSFIIDRTGCDTAEEGFPTSPTRASYSSGAVERSNRMPNLPKLPLRLRRSGTAGSKVSVKGMRGKAGSITESMLAREEEALEMYFGHGMGDE